MKQQTGQKEGLYLQLFCPVNIVGKEHRQQTVDGAFSIPIKSPYLYDKLKNESEYRLW